MSPDLSHLIRWTPLLSLADRPHLTVKLEACQTSGSFKIRGAVRTLLALDEQDDPRPVVTVSMGNTAFSLAWAGRMLGRPVTVIMPETVSAAKLALTREIGAEVILHGRTGSEALAFCQDFVANGDYYFLHPHKSEPFLEGSESIASEILADRPTTRRLYVPVGGGGLLSAICAAVNKVSPANDLEIVGVEAERSPAFQRSFEAGHAVSVPDLETIADALTISEPDPDVLSVVTARTTRIDTVSEQEIKTAMRQLLDEFRIVVEPGGAAPLAAMLNHDDGIASSAIISGGNISVSRFQELTGLS